MSLATQTYGDDTFASKADAMEDAAMYYGADCPHIEYSGSGDTWRWRFVPAGAAVDSEVLRFAPELADDSAMPSERKIELAETAATERWQDGATYVPTDDAISAAQADEFIAAAEALPDVPVSMVSVKLTATMAAETLEGLRAYLRSQGVLGFTVTERPAGSKAPKVTGERVARDDPSKCRVNGMTWNIEALAGKDDTNFRACRSMKERVDAHVKNRDLLMLNTLSWAGCPGHDKPGNTYQKQGAAYLANAKAYVAQQIAFDNAARVGELD